MNVEHEVAVLAKKLDKIVSDAHSVSINYRKHVIVEVWSTNQVPVTLLTILQNRGWISRQL